MAEQVADVLDLVLDHGRSLEREPPGDHPDVFGQAHRPEHLGSEHPTVANLGPFFQLRVVPENLHRRFRVRVVGGFESHLGDADFLEERADGADEVAEGQVAIGDEPLYLMELTQMGRIHRFVAKHPIDREVLFGSEAALLVGELVEHLCGDGGGVRAEEVLHGLFAFEHAAVADGSESAGFVG